MTGPDQRPARATALRAAAIVVALVSLVIASQAKDAGGASQVFGGVVALIGLIVVFSLWERSAQHLVPLADEVLERDRRPPILYLRSFESDSEVSSLEELLAAMLGRVGPFIAIGQPGEKLPKLGAARKYVGESEWKPYVATTLSRAAMVVMRAGRTTGLGWEVGQCVRRLDPRRLVVLVPSDEAQFQAFRQQAGEAGLALPDYPSRSVAPYRAGEFCGLVCFAGNWQPRFIPFPRAAFFGANHEIPTAQTRFGTRLQFAFAEVMASLGLPWELPRRAWAFIGILVFLAVMLVFIAVLGWLVSTGQLK